MSATDSRGGALPSFWIDKVPIYGDLILAPMAGYSDVPFRLLCRTMGSAMSYSPCILDDGIVYGSRRSQALTHFLPQERPVALQMLGKDDERLVDACLRLLPLGPDIIDLNFGCPAKRVSGRGRGAALLREPATIARIAQRLAAALPVPVSAKIRLGWDEDSRNYLEIAHILEDSGIAAIAVHGRTKAQGYSGQADWEAIARVKQAVAVPVLANGDVRTPADAVAIRQVTGCDGVLIGRGAIGNPWIFQHRDVAGIGYRERLPVIRQHLADMMQYYGERVGVLLFRKHAVQYIRYLVGAAEFRGQIVAAESAQALLELLEAWDAPLGGDVSWPDDEADQSEGEPN